MLNKRCLSDLSKIFLLSFVFTLVFIACAPVAVPTTATNSETEYSVDKLSVSLDEASAQVRPDTSQQVPKMLVRPHLQGQVEPAVEPGDEIVGYDMAWKAQEPLTVAQRLAGALDVMLGKDVTEKDVAEMLVDNEALKLVVEGDQAGSWVRIGNTPVLARYQQEYDELRLIHEEWDVIDDPDGDIGEEGAQELAEVYLKMLGENGVIDPRLYAQAAMQLGYKMVVDGSVDEEVKPGRIVEYRITFRPRLNGIEMANAGLRLGILSSGQLANLRQGGVTPAGEWEEGVLESSVPGATREVRVSTKELMDRFFNEALEEGEVQVAWSRIMYAMPEGKSEAVVEPMLLISYTEVRRSDGQLVASRRKTVAYSLTDPNAAPINFDVPADR